ncbi:MAG: methylated-DNA-[protein]-cysteine S-methyltransferase [Candidatus Atribacteria bacterium]|nr:methylated-DNA-[protein]-cysteine S-methyltransferase [Candidatus Atribacteria bacterium]
MSRAYFSYLRTWLGFSILSWQEDKLRAFILPQQNKEKALTIFQEKAKFSFCPHPQEKSPFPSLEQAIQNYFNGYPASFSFPLYLNELPSFTQEVLQTTALIPYGETLTYGQVAKKIGKPRASRAVGRALGQNPLPLLIPCHRVIACHNWGGYSTYGLRFKILLLSIELRSNSGSGSIPLV